MAELRQNTWTLNSWYDQDVAGDALYEASGKLWSWGYNGYGWLGLNDVVWRSSPTQIGTDTRWTQVMTTGSSNKLGMKQDGSLWGWGRNQGTVGGGSLGINNAVHQSSPCQLPGTGWQMTRDTFQSSCGATSAIKTDGSLWIWGSNEAAALGLPRVAPYWYYLLEYSSPVQLPGTYSKTRYGTRLSTSGGLWMWGQNTRGECGQNTNPTTMAAYSSPVQIPGTWSDVARTGGDSTKTLCSGIKTDGTLWSWGYNTYGGLGLSDRNDRSSPVQLPGTWLRCATSMDANVQAWQKPDGSIWFSGYGPTSYTFGIGNVSSPTQVPGTMIPSISQFHVGTMGLFFDEPNNKCYVTGPNYAGQQGNNQGSGTGYIPVTYVPSVWDKFKDTGIGKDQFGTANLSNFAIEQQ